MTFSFEEAGKAPQQSRRRGFILRMAVLSGAITLVCLVPVVLAIVNIAQGNVGYSVMLVVFGLVSSLTGYWFLAYMRDLNAELITVEGEIGRKWVRGMIMELFIQSCYVTVDGRIFVIPRYDYSTLLETDLIRIQCYPHSLTVETIERYDELTKRFIPTDDRYIDA